MGQGRANPDEHGQGQEKRDLQSQSGHHCLRPADCHGWKTVQYLISSNILFQEGDYRVVYADKITHTFKENGEWKKSEINLQNPQNLIYLSVSRVFGLYKSQALREGDKPLPAATVEYYLKNSPAFICDTKKVYFKKFDAKNGYPEIDEKGNKKFTYTSAFVFYLDKLNLNIADEH